MLTRDRTGFTGVGWSFRQWNTLVKRILKHEFKSLFLKFVCIILNEFICNSSSCIFNIYAFNSCK